MNTKAIFEKFEELFGNTYNTQLFFSPGRVNLIGEHTDYNGGHVFPCALTMGTYAVVRKREDRMMNFYSLNLSNAGVITASLDDLTNKNEYNWANYPLGVVWAFREKGIEIQSGFDMVLWGNIPAGSGLSSSASVEVLTGLIIKTLFDLESITMKDIALLGQYAENHFCGCNCGIMDQFVIAHGKKNHAVFLDTNLLEFQYAPIVLTGAKIVITNSNVKHSLVESEYNTRRQECTQALEALQQGASIQTLGDLDIKTFEELKHLIKDPIQRKRAKHAVYENQRTMEAVKALEMGDIDRFGELMNQSHISLRDDYAVSCDEVDLLVDLAWNCEGVIGSRITGGGFGGCTVSIVKEHNIPTFVETITKEYKEQTGLHAEIYIADIGDGAKILEVAEVM